MKKYKVILADPPWQWKTWSKKGRTKTPDKHYAEMSLDKIKKLNVQKYAANDCVLLLWTTYPHILDAFKIINAWGFKFSTIAFTWVKTNKNSGSIFMGMGYWTRTNAEICMLAKQGHPHRQAADVRQVIISPRRRHSQKPDEQYKRIERLLIGPYLELFARYKHKHWDIWGNELKNDIDLK